MKQLSMDELNRLAPNDYLSAEKIPVAVVLDNVRSGLNVGAIFRTCDAFSIECIYLCGITAQPPHAEILKTALGATDTVKWQYSNDVLDVLKNLKEQGYTLFPVEQTDQSILLDQIEIHQYLPLVLIFGNEMRGIGDEVLSMCDKSIEVPQSGVKHSLNVATTAGIVLWECYRQFRLRRFLSPES